VPVIFLTAKNDEGSIVGGFDCDGIDYVTKPFSQREVVFTMGAIGESRSLETGNHVKRVATYSYILAIKYGLSEKQARLLQEASPMHNIGKVGIPDAILNKAGKLNPDEWETMKTHATLGYEMLQYSERPILKARLHWP
jgi:response regulator RpfG family c-di-GMP phosphodiesterase